MRRIGILGGMGPEATILMQQRLLQAVQAEDDSDHIPLLIDMNPQVPSRIAHLIEGTGGDPAPVLAEMARRLETGGAEALAMPCNTAHSYAASIEAAVDIPLLNVVTLSADRAGAGKVGILASPATRITGVFDRALEKVGATPVWLRDDTPLLHAIRIIKANGATVEARNILRAASEELLAMGAETQLVGCSEFSLIAEAASAEAQVIDTLDVLVDAVVAFATAKD
ncbi:aspartate/glutamate racemase family protein [Nioella ostreopsis]|uniref:aspartate/glutamate racemase family protein n=1 Tax=Nioella ostreopsis TaxID=2448479 RepID=UPI000FDA2C03|nr:amino acid racemase [Nioella ostreopsis]